MALGLGTIISGVGGLIGAFGRRSQARAAAKAIDFNIDQILSRSDIETTLRQREGQREEGAISAAAGASGLMAGGSASDILLESARNTAFDLSSIRTQADLQVKAMQQQKKAGQRAASLNFATSLIGTGANVVNDLNLFGKKG